MLPLLAQLHPGALTTGPSVKRPRLEDGEDGEDGEAAPEPAPHPPLHLLGLPPDALEILLRQLDDDPGEPMLLVRRVKHKYNGTKYVPDQEDVFYMRLPDPKAGPLNAARFEKDDYLGPTILEGIVDMAGFDADTTMTQFLRVADDDATPIVLIQEGVYDEDDYTIFDFVNDAAYIVTHQSPYVHTWKNTRGERLLFDTWPTFKSYVAIVLLIDQYS